jgi:CTP:molybdopterin cytidylyltransferase MocA
MQLEGRSLLEWAASSFGQAGVKRITVITGHRADAVEAEAQRLGLACVHNPDYAQGMFSSVRVAARAVGDLDAFFLLPVDIPLVRPAVIAALIAARRGCPARDAVFYPTYGNERGHPPLIPASQVPAILAHDGQGGLRSLLDGRPGLDVPVWDRGVLLDVDAPEDFMVLRRKARRLGIGEPAEIRSLAVLTMPERGLAHGRAVARVAVRLGEVLGRHGQPLDLELLHNAALVHDVAKGQKGHEARGGEMLAALGLDGLAPVVAAHRDVAPPASGVLTETAVVCLADKLVRGPLRIDVQSRFQEKLNQYMKDGEVCQAIRGRMNNALGLQALVERISGHDIETVLDGVLA